MYTAWTSHVHIQKNQIKPEKYITHHPEIYRETLDLYYVHIQKYIVEHHMYAMWTSQKYNIEHHIYTMWTLEKNLEHHIYTIWTS